MSGQCCGCWWACTVHRLATQLHMQLDMPMLETMHGRSCELDMDVHQQVHALL